MKKKHCTFAVVSWAEVGYAAAFSRSEFARMIAGNRSPGAVGGIFFGNCPARKVSLLDPIGAFCYE